jgi:hypothetical protein
LQAPARETPNRQASDRGSDRGEQTWGTASYALSTASAAVGLYVVLWATVTLREAITTDEKKIGIRQLAVPRVLLVGGEAPKRYQWRAKKEEILAKIHRAREALLSQAISRTGH